MSTLVTLPRVSLQAALQAHLRSLGTMDTETLRYPNAPSVTTVEPLCEAVRAAEGERAESETKLHAASREMRRREEAFPALLAVVEAVEWLQTAEGEWCPSCRWGRTVGHLPACALHAALVAAGRRNG